MTELIAFAMVLCVVCPIAFAANYVFMKRHTEQTIRDVMAALRGDGK